MSSAFFFFFTGPSEKENAASASAETFSISVKPLNGIQRNLS